MLPMMKLAAWPGDELGDAGRLPLPVIEIATRLPAGWSCHSFHWRTWSTGRTIPGCRGTARSARPSYTSACRPSPMPLLGIHDVTAPAVGSVKMPVAGMGVTPSRVFAENACRRDTRSWW